MEAKDGLLTIKDWIESFLNFQEEDFQFFKDKEALKEKLLRPKEFLDYIRKRMEMRKAFYKLFKHVSWHNLTPEDLIWSHQKLDEILEKETLITDLINKVLDVITELYFGDEVKELKNTLTLVQEEKIVIQ